ncbi:MAG: phage/plasmid primase, P4 family, partial [bacterium]|nr:phage/plasmid primase, P4 family [bacterium]
CERGARLCGLDPGETGRTFESGYGDGLSQSGPNRSTSMSKQPSGGFESDGIGHAERFAMMHRDWARYCVQEGEWYVYKTNRWVRSSVEAQAMAKETARTIEDQSVRRKASSKQGVKEILFLASSEPGMSVSASAFDGDPMLFNCQSGVIDLRSGTLRKHTPRDLMRHYSGVRYSPGKDCPLWLSFLEVVCGGDQELIGYLQRVCGYLLTGDVSEQCLFFLLGDGCNGKSVFASVLQHILGSYAVRVPAELLMRPPRGGHGGPTPDAARLMGARLAVSTELEEGRRFAEVRIKELTGGDRQVARPLYGHPVEFDPTHKLLLFGNHTPEIVNNDEGIWRRMRLVPFSVTIDKHRRDPHLIEKLKAESGAILAWMVRGCVRWNQNGLGVPEAVRNATSGYRHESDAVGRFIEECCERVPGVELPKADLYVRYKAWCERNGEHAISPKALFPRMKDLGVKEGRRGGVRFWIGLVIREDEP